MMNEKERQFILKVSDSLREKGFNPNQIESMTKVDFYNGCTVEESVEKWLTFGTLKKIKR